MVSNTLDLLEIQDNLSREDFQSFAAEQKPDFPKDNDLHQLTLAVQQLVQQLPQILSETTHKNALMASTAALQEVEKTTAQQDVLNIEEYRTQREEAVNNMSTIQVSDNSLSIAFIKSILPENTN